MFNYTYNPTFWVNDETELNATNLNNIEFAISALVDYCNSLGTWSIIEDVSSNLSVSYNAHEVLNISSNYILPTSEENVSLGSSDYKFNNLYLSGYLSDGINQITIEQLTNIAQDNTTYAKDGKLVVNEIKASHPTPISIIEDVEYYHVTQLMISNMLVNAGAKAYDAITGEELSSIPAQYAILYAYYNGVRQFSLCLSGFRYSINIIQMQTVSSRSFDVVHSLEEMDDSYTKICLPEQYTKYCILKTDNLLFIYYNLVSDETYEPVEKITDGVHEVNIQDGRISKNYITNGYLRSDFTWHTIDIESMTLIYYADLKSRRDNNILVPGRFYRIRDYNFTTTVAYTHSAGHQFDIIVLALDKSHLATKAWAIQHEGDTYFANNNLAAWQLWYDLDNDTTKYEWADAVNGKGVIYRMIDEFENDVPYDFKNLIYEYPHGFIYNQWSNDYTFVRDESLDANGYIGWRTNRTPNAWSNPYCFTDISYINYETVIYSDVSGTVISHGGKIFLTMNVAYETYTFNQRNAQSINEDASLTGDTMQEEYNCKNNIIKPYSSNNIQKLNFITCYSTLYYLLCSHNFFDYHCYNIILKEASYRNKFNKNCYNNTLSDHCRDNEFDCNCSLNICLNYFSQNKLGQLCSNNTFGVYNTNIILKYHVTYSVMANYVAYTTLGNNCRSNHFGISHTTRYQKNIILDDDCSYINLTCADTTASSTNMLQNVHIHSGIHGTDDSNLLTIQVPDRNLPYTIDYYADGSQEVIIGGNE